MKDATAPLNIVVRESHICLAKQHRRDPFYCVVAQALRKVKGVVDAKVFKTYTTVSFKDGSVVRYRTPKCLAEGLTYWDRMGEWKLPVGTYQLEVPRPSDTIKAKKTYATNAKRRVVVGTYNYVYGPRGEQQQPRTTSARHFFNCFARKAA